MGSWWRRLGLTCLTVAIFWLSACSLPVVAHPVTRTLGGRYADVPVTRYQPAAAIVVLGGSMIPAAPPMFPYRDLTARSARVWLAARLYHAGKAPVIIVSGGPIPWLTNTHTPEVVAMKTFLEALGVPVNTAVMDTHSRRRTGKQLT